MRFTIFTPTYNRAKTLPRVYKSLLAQTNQDFIWLIIDDGSMDNTGELVNEWIGEKKLKIEYKFKENGGKHTAMRLAYQMAKTKYFIGIDSDDELTPEAVEIFNKEWQKIEDEDSEENFAEVSALTHSSDGKLIGDFYFPDRKEYIDSFWHEMVLKYKNNNEHIVCWNLEKLKECTNIPEKFWLSDKINYFAEYILWARIGKNYKTRYINKNLRIYHFDGGDSLLRSEDKTKGHYNNLVGNKYFLDENLKCFFWNPTYFFNLILKFIVSGIVLNISPYKIVQEIKTYNLKITYILFWPIGFMAWGYFKFIKKRFWI